MRWILEWLGLRKKDEKLAGKWAVLLIDMQTGYSHNFSEPSWRKLIARQMNVINYCADHDIPLAVVEFEGCGKTDEILAEAAKRVPRCVWVVKEGCDAFGPAIVAESSCDAFKSSSPTDWLRYWEIDGILLLGIFAYDCVQKTAMGALANGLKIATAKGLISECGMITYGWYREKGLCFKNYRVLLESLSAVQDELGKEKKIR